jgi:uncharacterized membrane protein YfcA
MMPANQAVSIPTTTTTNGLLVDPLLPLRQRRRNESKAALLLAAGLLVGTAAVFLVAWPLDDQVELLDQPRQLLESLHTAPADAYLIHHHHRHKPLWPLSSRDVAGFMLAMLGLLIAAGGGIGGGGILVPIYILVWNFTPKHAIPLSNITVFGGAVANTALNWPKRHPTADRPLIDWDLILVMEPLTIAGALGGAIFNKLLPEQLLCVLLVVLLVATAVETLKKARKMYMKESALLKSGESELTRLAQQQDDNDGDDENDAEKGQDEKAATAEPLATADLPEDAQFAVKPASSTGPAKLPNQNDQNDEQDRRRAQLHAILQAERVTPLYNVQVLVAMFVVVVAMNVLKGGGAFRSPLGITCGSAGFWLAQAAILAFILAVAAHVRTYLLQRYHLKQRLQYPYVEGDIEWNERNSIVYPLVCTLAGFFAGMFGVGGGIVKGPLMLAMGVHPAVSAASSACMILFTSFSATTSFVVFGLLRADYGVVCLLVGFVTTWCGQVAMNVLMQRTQRASYIAYSIGGVVLLSALLMTVQSVLSMAERAEMQAAGVLVEKGICAK